MLLYLEEIHLLQREEIRGCNRMGYRHIPEEMCQLFLNSHLKFLSVCTHIQYPNVNIFIDKISFVIRNLIT